MILVKGDDPMFRSLHMKLVLIMVLLIISLMTVVGAFLMNSVVRFYLNDFNERMTTMFSAENIDFYEDLTQPYEGETDGVEGLQSVLRPSMGELGVDGRTRNYFILDGTTGAYLAGSDEELGRSLDVSPNVLEAIRTGQPASSADITENYMDAAIPITRGNGSYIIYIYDNRQNIQELNSALFVLIIQALIFGLVSSVLLSFLLAKTMITPIERLTAGAKRVAAGDFSRKIEVSAKDEIGVLTTTFNSMARQLQATIREAENERNKLDTLFLHMTDGVVAFASDGSVLHSNPAVSQMLGKEVSFYDYDALFGQQFPFEQVMSLQRPDFVSGELTAGGRILELYLAPFSDGEDGGVMAVLHDVTAQRKNEEMRKEFVANVSHELRTPLTNIRSYAETLVDNAGELPPDTEKNFLGVILNESDRMTHIVQDLLTLSRFDSGKSELKLAPFSFEQSIRDIYNAVLLEAQRHGHVLTVELEPDLPEIIGDRDRILQVMMNVVSNAIKYTPDGGTGRIRISAGRAGEKVWMEVSDNGIGIPAEDRPRIFERFYRVDKARSRESGGTGLGLSIAKEIVDRHQGSIGPVDRPGPGLTIRIELPIGGPAHER